MAAGQPGILIDHRRQPLRRLGIGALPQRAERTARGHDRQIADLVVRRDLRQLVRHAGAAGNARDQPLGPRQHAFQHPLRAAHFPQHVDVDRALATGVIPGALPLLARALDGIFDQFLMPLAPGQRAVDLGNDLALGVIAVGIARRHGADPAGRGPSPRRRMVRGGDALAPFDQRPHFPAVIEVRVSSINSDWPMGPPMTMRSPRPMASA